jgi:putative ABC transport system permease protein
LKYPDDIVWMPANPVFRDEAVRQVKEALARIHNFSGNDERAVHTYVFNEYIHLVDTMGIALRLLLGFIGTLTLAIGGVGLANIMLVSVTQRTREIGMLKSIGATRRAILAQFLLEAVAIVTVGGVIGVAAGWAVTAVLGSLPLLGPLFHQTNGAGDIGDHLDGVAGEHWFDRRIAARHQSRAPGPHRGVEVRVANTPPA